MNQLSNDEGCAWLHNEMALCLHLAEATQAPADAVVAGAAAKVGGGSKKKAKPRAKPEDTLTHWR